MARPRERARDRAARLGSKARWIAQISETPSTELRAEIERQRAELKTAGNSHRQSVILDIERELRARKGDLSANFGKRMALRRIRRGLFSLELAEGLGVTATTVRHMELGRVARLDLELIDALARELDVSLDWLFLGKKLKKGARNEEV